MMFTELFVPAGRFDADALREVARGLTMRRLLTHATELRDVEGASEAASADPGVLDLLESIDHVVVHEIGTWVVGGRALGPDDAPRWVVRVHVPGAWRKGMSAFLVAAMTRALSQAEGDPELASPEPHVEVHVLGVPEGGYGLFGRVVGESTLLDMISDAKRADVSAAPPGMLVDPVCGMVASEAVHTLEHDGTTYGFCSPGCRRHFAAKLAPGR